MRRDIFIETGNVAKLRKSLSALSDTEQGRPGIGVVQGEAGRGKTMAAKEWHAMNGGIFLRVMEGWSQFSFLQALTYKICGERPNNTNRCRTRIMDSLAKTPQPIIVDEADRLLMPRIEDLRDVHDMTGCPVILIGEEGFYPRLHARKRVHSRVVDVVNFDPITPDDVMLFAAQAAALEVTPEACHKLAALAKGSFRVVYGYILHLEDYAKAQATNTIDAKAIEALRIGRA
ncbi:AAA family ATPase [Pseudodesulfovibrio sp.]|uniref:AAA family ATPase n=1 Tax=unclassified Pseudodesulfovibrio TaxID=2661612 RepID=UPI003B002433